MKAETILRETDELISDLISYNQESEQDSIEAAALLQRCDKAVDKMTALWAAGIKEEMEAKKEELFNARYEALNV
jgi:hypothetical protein